MSERPNQNNKHWNNRRIIDIRFTENEFTTEHTENTETRKGVGENGNIAIRQFSPSPYLPLLRFFFSVSYGVKSFPSVPHLIGLI